MRRAAASDLAEPSGSSMKELVVGNVNAAVGALGQRFLDRLLHALRAHRKRHHFAAVLFLEAQGFFERKAVGLVHLESDIGFADPERRRRCAEARLWRELV